MTLRHGGRAVSRPKAFGAALAVAALAMVGIASPGVVAPAAAEETGTPVYRPFTIVQANISKDLGPAKFQADVDRVYAEQPDFVTFNEVHARDTAVLAPPGYALFRTPGPRTGWAPVAWRTDVWSAIGQGTWKISDRPPGARKPLLGVRYANWVTLTTAAGEVVSVISTHIAPNDPETDQLLVPSLKRLRQLANDLHQYGPVIIGGDFNMGYRSDRYQPQYLAQAGLTNTFEMTGSPFVTHRRGGIIDYLFVGPTGRFIVDEQYPVVMNSDHRMVVARMQLVSDPPEEVLPRFTPGKVVSDARGSNAERRAIRALQLKAIAATPAGAAIHVASERIRGGALLQALIDAKTRGAEVTVITGFRDLSAHELQLRKLLGNKKSASSYFVKAGRAWPSGRAKGSSGYLKPTLLLISRTGATEAFGMWADCDMGLTSMQPKWGKVCTATVTTSLVKYDRAYGRYLAVIGRSY